MKNILIVSPLQYYYLPVSSGRSHAGGSERQVNFLIEHLSEHEADTRVVILCNRAAGIPRYLVHNGVRVYPVLLSRPDPFSLLSDLLTLSRVIERENITHVYVKTDPTPLMMSVLIDRFRPVKVVYSFGMDVDHRGHRKWISRIHHRAFLFALRFADMVQCQTSEQLSDLRSRALDGRVVHNVIPKGQAVDGDGGRYLLWIGNMNEHTKRPHLLVPMARAMPEELFVVIGIKLEEHRYYIARVLGEMDALANVTYLDFVPPDEMMGYYSNAKALVNTSKKEGFPNTFLEAWSAGKPVVSFHVNPGGVLNDPRLGIVSNDPAEIARFISAAGEGDGARYRREYVLKNHSPEIELRKLADYLDRL